MSKKKLKQSIEELEKRLDSLEKKVYVPALRGEPDFRVNIIRDKKNCVYPTAWRDGSYFLLR